MAHAVFMRKATSPVAEDSSVLHNDPEDEDMDLHGIYWLEHVNFIVDDQAEAERFYCEGIGFKRDPNHRYD